MIVVLVDRTCTHSAPEDSQVEKISVEMTDPEMSRPRAVYLDQERRDSRVNSAGKDSGNV